MKNGQSFTRVLGGIAHVPAGNEMHGHGVGRGEGVKRGHQVQFILAGGKEGIDNLHGNLDFYLRLLGVMLVEDMNDQVIVLFGDADVAIIALHGDELAVLGSADSLDQGAEVDIINMSIVDLDLAVVDAVFVDGGENLFR